VAPSPHDNTARVMPDIAADARPALAGVLDWVGMGEMEMPVLLAGDDGRTISSGARVNAFVNLTRPEARGIHMSRLYLHVDKALSAEPVTPCSLRRLLRDFLESHAELSDRAMVSIRFEHLVRRPALASDNSGWRAYPVRLTAVMDRGHFAVELAVDVTYSSTCPCSAALARQLIQEQFEADFAAGKPLDREAVLAWLGSEQGIRATPHSQRSVAEVKVRLLPSFQDFPIVALIDRIEQALRTPVQTAVKRADEQAFALLNGQNLMFCEDAARRIQAALEQDERISDFWARVSHQESLHPHDAVAVTSKGVPGGYSAVPDGLLPR
jgi:GTP cyclohydrolase I